MRNQFSFKCLLAVRWSNVIFTVASLFITEMALADVPQAIAVVKPSVVIVGTYKLTNSPRFNLRGTGFVVGNGNWAVTNAHVIPEGADLDLDTKIVVQVRIGQKDLQIRQAKVLDVDKLHDLALLQLAWSACLHHAAGN